MPAATASDAHADREVIDTLLDHHSTGTPAGSEPGVGGPAAGTGTGTGSDPQGGTGAKGFEVYGDSAYADGATLDEQTARGHDMRTKAPPARNANGYSKDQFNIDLAAGTVTCPAQRTVAIRKGLRYRVARFWPWTGRGSESMSARERFAKAGSEVPSGRR